MVDVGRNLRRMMVDNGDNQLITLSGIICLTPPLARGTNDRDLKSSNIGCVKRPRVIASQKKKQRKAPAA
jgi:hypothetical protein